MAFPAFQTILVASESAPTRHAYHKRASLLADHVARHGILASVKHIPGASSESREVSVPSPGYPHVWCEFRSSLFDRRTLHVYPRNLVFVTINSNQ